MTALAYSLWFVIPISLILSYWLCYSIFILTKNLIQKANHQVINLVDIVNQQLPQTQCGQCGFNGCRPYAEAIVRGEAINKCPPGGQSTIRALANLMNETAIELDPAHGFYSLPTIVKIREAECIGCTKCIQACPVDAILGAGKLMHTVIDHECTGCNLCIEPCPVDCIDVIFLNQSQPSHWQVPKPSHGSLYPVRAGGLL